MNYALAYEHRLDAARCMMMQAVLEGRGCGHACHEYYQSRRRDDVPSHLPQRELEEMSRDGSRWLLEWCGAETDSLSRERAWRDRPPV